MFDASGVNTRMANEVALFSLDCPFRHPGGHKRASCLDIYTLCVSHSSGMTKSTTPTPDCSYHSYTHTFNTTVSFLLCQLLLPLCICQGLERVLLIQSFHREHWTLLIDSPARSV
eukprot:Gregarina_sp_Pseudo_9__5760@NODE_84_length_4448_cov_24_851667_g76_i0_p4_GENE_NODE_84_length_4448_cov_24_851667_g76_i0NODE_84_length_4448_cov_24_851667_g76_i0_p4_ORF_typecomplete_len115_score9_98_NODE_84_length_4448_cov_24_851667_g76_i035193863